MLWLVSSLALCASALALPTAFAPPPPPQSPPSGLPVEDAMGRMKGWVRQNPKAAQLALSQLFGTINGLMDTSRNGKVMRPELKAAHAELGPYWAVAMRGRLTSLSQWMGKLDADSDGHMSFVELLNLFSQEPLGSEWDALASYVLMKLVDSDRNGQLSEAELASTVGSPLYQHLLEPALNLQVAPPAPAPAQATAPEPVQIPVFSGYGPAPAAPIPAPAPPPPSLPAPPPPSFAAAPQPAFQGYGSSFVPQPPPPPPPAPAPTAFAAPPPPQPSPSAKLIDISRFTPVVDPVAAAPAAPSAFSYGQASPPQLSQPVTVGAELSRLRQLIKADRVAAESLVRGVGPELLQLLDVNGNGGADTGDLKIIHQLLVPYWAQHIAAQTNKALVDLGTFLSIDFTNNHEIVVPEILAVVIDNPDNPLWDALASALYLSVDTNQDGLLTQPEFDAVDPKIKQLLQL